MNNSTVTRAPPNNEISYVNMIYIVTGSLAILGNAILLLIICSRYQYFKKSAFIFGLALCDMLHGGAIMTSAVLRTKYQTLPSSQSMVRSTYCILTISDFWILGNQGTALMLLLIGIERLVAVQFFAWYRVNWTKRLSWISMCLVLVFCFFSICLAYYLASQATTLTSINCLFILVVGKPYNFYNYSISILAGFISNVCTVLSLVLCLIQLNRFRKYPNTSNATIQSHIKKQWHLSKTMIGCTICDFGLVVIPNILMFMISSFNINAASLGLQNVTTYAPPLLCIKGFLNLFCCLLFNPEFRRQVSNIVHLKNVSIVPISLTAAPHSRHVKPIHSKDASFMN